MGIAIVRYNMSNITGGHAAFLDSSCVVDSITYNAVDLAMPSGILRVQSDRVFTHFAARIAGEWRVFEITGIHAINGAVIEYNYTLDYIKDCMINTYDFNVAGGGTPEWFYAPVIERVRIPSATSNDPGDYDFCNKYADDPLFKFTPKITKTRTECGLLYGYDVGYQQLFALVVASSVEDDGMPYVYLLTPTNLRTVIGYLNTSQYASAFYKQIIGCYMIPNAYKQGDTINLGGVFTTNVSLDYTGIDENGDTFSDVVLTNVIRASRTYPLGALPVCSTTWNPSSLIFVQADNFIDLNHKQHVLYIPYIGNVPLTPALAADNQGGFPIYLGFRYNLVDGTMSVTLPYNNGLYMADVPMPSITLPSGAQAFSLYSNELKLQGQAATGLLNIGAQAVTGNVAGVIGGAMGMVNTIINKDISDSLAKASGQAYSTSSGWMGNYDRRVALVSYEETPYVTFSSHVKTLGCICGRSLVRVTQDVNDIIGMAFKFDPDSLATTLNNRYEWREPLRQAMLNDYILFNTPYTL